MLNLATLTPAWRSCFKHSWEEVAGPIVATILTWRMGMISRLVKGGLADIGGGGGIFCDRNNQKFHEVFSQVSWSIEWKVFVSLGKPKKGIPLLMEWPNSQAPRIHRGYGVNVRRNESR